MDQARQPTGDSRTPVRVLALTRKADSSSFQARVLDYVGLLAQRGIEVQWRPFGQTRAQRAESAAMTAWADVVWWHRYLAAPWKARPWMRAARCVVYDYDDAILYSAVARRGRGRLSLSRWLKFWTLLRRCDAVLAASRTLAGYAMPYCSRTLVVPMSVPIPDHLPDRPPAGDGVELLWLGSASTGKYLSELRQPLDLLAEQRPGVRLRLVGHASADLGRMPVDYRPWSPDQQQRALEQCHLGLCPMPDAAWTRGKCPYKILQYMAWGMAWVGSDVGENRTAAGQDAPAPRGLLVRGRDGWLEALLKLVDDEPLRLRLGEAGRRHVMASHEAGRVADRLAEVFRALAEKKEPATGWGD